MEEMSIPKHLPICLKPKFIPTFRAVYKVVFDQDKVFILYEMQIEKNKKQTRIYI